MNLPLREEGLWWPPESPQTWGAGALDLKNEGFSLKSIVGPLSNIVPLIGQPNPGPAILHGRSHSGSNFTCTDTIYSNWSQAATPTGGHAVTDLAILGTVYKGAHFSSLADIVFRRAVWLYSNLHTWMDHVAPLATNRTAVEPQTYQVVNQRGVTWHVDIDGFQMGNDFNCTFSRKSGR